MKTKKSRLEQLAEILPAPVQPGSNVHPDPVVQPDPQPHAAQPWAHIVERMGNVPPGGRLPVPPQGFVRMDVQQFRALSKPTASHKSELQAAIREIQAMEADGSYARVFGTVVPPARVLIAVLQRAAGWSDESRAATAWSAYARDQRSIAWDDGLTLMAALAPVFDTAVTHDPSVGASRPGLVAFLGARSEVSKRGAATRKRAKQARATPTAATAQGGAPPTHGGVSPPVQNPQGPAADAGTNPQGPAR